LIYIYIYIYIERERESVYLSNRFTFRGDKTDISLMTEIEGAGKFV